MSDTLIGVDVGGTKISVAALDGSVLGEPSITPTDTRSGGHLLDQLTELIGAMGPARSVGVESARLPGGTASKRSVLDLKAP